MNDIAAEAAKAQAHLLDLQGQQDAAREESANHIEQARIHNAATRDANAKAAALGRQIAATQATLKELGVSLKVQTELAAVQQLRAQTEADAKAIAQQQADRSAELDAMKVELSNLIAAAKTTQPE